MFKIDKEGKVTGVKVKEPHKALEKEAVRVIQLLPQMISGINTGKKVEVKYTKPITLLIEKPKKKRRKFKF